MFGHSSHIIKPVCKPIAQLTVDMGKMLESAQCHRPVCGTDRLETRVDRVLRFLSGFYAGNYQAGRVLRLSSQFPWRILSPWRNTKT